MKDVLPLDNREVCADLYKLASDLDEYLREIRCNNLDGSESGLGDLLGKSYELLNDIRVNEDGGLRTWEVYLPGDNGALWVAATESDIRRFNLRVHELSVHPSHEDMIFVLPRDHALFAGRIMDALTKMSPKS